MGAVSSSVSHRRRSVLITRNIYALDGWILKKDLSAAESAAITAKSG